MSEYYITDAELAEYHAYHTQQDVIANMEDGLKILKEMTLPQDVCLVAGAMITFDKGLSSFLNMMYKNVPNFFLLSEVTAEFRRYTKEKIRFPYICTPHLLAKEMFAISIDVDVTDEMDALSKCKQYIREAIENITERQLHLGKGYAYLWSYYAYKYIDMLLEKLKPVEVILWNEFYAFHHIFRGICIERNIPIKYMEFGCLPGTICIEEGGQQGESKVAVEYKAFKNKNIGRKEIQNAKYVIAYLKETALNRNVQPKLLFSDLHLRSYESKRKNILFIGQNDHESGMVPYTEHTRKYHSPIFESTLEALEYLEILAIQNGWNLLFKPHPITNYLGHDSEEDRIYADVVKDVDINSIIDVSNVVVTILSQVSYISLIREKPVVMLGYTQLNGKECTYEAYEKSQIEKKIKQAINYGYTKKQRNNFQKHVAQLLKYYLYDDCVEREVRFGMKL